MSQPGPDAKPERAVFPADGLKTYGLMAVVRGATPAIDRGPEDTVFTWPHLLYRELLLLLLTVGVIWGIALAVPAPLEEMANASVTPNPAKAPWYFAGLQELLVYFDPWIAGVTIPGLIVVGLMAIPFVDKNPRGVGSYAFWRRPFATAVFTLGLGTWFVLIGIGTIFRGPNWAWYGLGESWEVHKQTTSLARDLPLATGLAWVAAYFGGGFLLPTVLCGSFRRRLGWIRFLTVVFFVLCIVGVLLKIWLRLQFNIKYVLHTPWFNV